MEEENLATLLQCCLDEMVARLHARLDAAGFGDIHPAHGVVFDHIGVSGARLTELARRVGMSKQMMLYLVDPLERGGYVERQVDPTDARAKILRLTERGWRAVHLAEAALRQTEEEFARLIGVDEMRQVRTGLT